MARPKGERTRGWTPSQVVAYNLTQARLLRGMTQAEVAERLSTFTGTSWSAVTVAQAEGSVSGKRVRQFTANELVALARTFDLPVLYFFLPPPDGAGSLHTPDAGRRSWEYLLMLVWGHARNFEPVADRAAPWAHASPDLVPRADLVTPASDLSYLVGERQREPIRPQDVLAIAFNGMARRHIRGSFAGRDLQELASNLRRLADAFEAFDTYPPGTFFDPDTLREVTGRAERGQDEGP